MRYRYKPVFDGSELIAFAYWNGDCVQHYYIKPFFCVSELPHAPKPSEKQVVIKSLDEITEKDYPQEVQAQLKQWHLGEEAFTDDLPVLKPGIKLEQLREFRNWFRRKAQSL
ncbi:MAG: hypothetical protein ABFS56_05715 [Pseudomonadota bacterium]